MFGTESFNQLDVSFLGTTFVEHTEMSFALVEGFGGLSETTRETIVNLRCDMKG